MTNWLWLSDGLLSFTTFVLSQRLTKQSSSAASLAAGALALLSLASMIGTLRFALNLAGPWPEVHGLASRLFGVAGLYLLVMAWLDHGGLVRLQRPWRWAHFLDGLVVFALLYWVGYLSQGQMIIGVLMALASFAAAIRFYQSGSAALSAIIVASSLLFVGNGLLVGGALSPLWGPFMFADAFHLLLTLWAVMIWQCFRQPSREPAVLSLP